MSSPQKKRVGRWRWWRITFSFVFRLFSLLHSVLFRSSSRCCMLLCSNLARCVIHGFKFHCTSFCRPPSSVLQKKNKKQQEPNGGGGLCARTHVFALSYYLHTTASTPSPIALIATAETEKRRRTCLFSFFFFFTCGTAKRKWEQSSFQHLRRVGQQQQLHFTHSNLFILIDSCKWITEKFQRSESNRLWRASTAAVEEIETVDWFFLLLKKTSQRHVLSICAAWKKRS